MNNKIDFNKGNVKSLEQKSFSSYELANEKINELLMQLIASEKYYSEEKIIKLATEFCEDQSLRIPYYQISVFVNDFLDEKRDEAEDSLSLTKTRLSNLSESKEIAKTPDLKKFLMKLVDHLDLAQHQFSNMSQRVESVIDQLDELTTSIQHKLESSLKKATIETDKLKENMNSQIISILAIFTGIAFILFGGVSALSGIKDAVISDGFSFVRVLSYASLIGSFVVVCCWGFIAIF